MKGKKLVQKLFSFAWKAALAFFIVSVVWVLLYRFVPVPVTELMIQRCIEQKLDGRPVKIKKDWVSINKISEHLQLAVVCSEDQNFLVHEGIDFKAMERAIEYNEKQKNKKHPKMRGASTISQQTAKNAFLWPGRSYVRKAFEVYFTFLIEKLWSKERIMEVYLNIIELGDGVYGAEAASQLYFHKPASSLTATDAALMAVVLPNPLKFRLDAPTGYMRGRQSWVLRQMGYWGNELDYSKEDELKQKAEEQEEKSNTRSVKKKKK